jgi:hypothetical protein
VPQQVRMCRQWRFHGAQADRVREDAREPFGEAFSSALWDGRRSR